MHSSQQENNTPTPAVSVTVPVYNTSQYLIKCLDSLKAQTLKDVEFIIVDDGSTDNSGVICDRYAELDSRFRVIHQKNGGLSSARQTGFDNARGKYLIVCDSDDWTEPEMYASLLEKAEETNADIVICGYYAEYPDRESVASQHTFKDLSSEGFPAELLECNNNSCWTKLVRKDLYARSCSRYELGINMGEDALILHKLLRGKPKIVQIPANLYHYRRQPGGDTYTANLKMSHIRQLDFVYRWLSTNYDAPRYRRLVALKAAEIVSACMRTQDLDMEYFNKFLKEELSWRSFLHIDTLSSPKRTLSALTKIIPLPSMQKFFGKIYPLIYR